MKNGVFPPNWVNLVMRFRGCGTPWRHLIGSQVTSATLLFFDSFAAAILHHHRRIIPSLLVLQPPRSRILIQLLLDCLPSARLVSISPRGDYFCTFAHGKFLASPTRSNSATAVTSRGDSLSGAGKPLGPQMGLLTRLRQHSTQQQAQFAALHSLHSPAVSHARASLRLLSSNFLTPERIFFSSPATSYARAILLLFSSDFLRQSDSSSLQFSHSEISFVFTVSWWSG